MQHRVMIEAVENHMPEVVIVDEIGTEAEALACRSIAERGVQLVGTAHGQMLENLIKNPTLSDLVRKASATFSLGSQAGEFKCSLSQPGKSFSTLLLEESCFLKGRQGTFEAA